MIRIVKRLLGLSSGQSASAKWEERWSRPEYAPHWLTSDIPEPVEQALADGFLAPGQRLIEVGCGGGHIAAWLADRGLHVLATDIAPAAIARARKEFLKGKDDLRFDVLDISGAAPAEGGFDCAFDRGCLHTFANAEQRAGYARNLAAALRPGAHVLIMHRAGQDRPDTAASEHTAGERIARDLADHFELLSSTPCAMSPRRNGLAIRLRRRRLA